MIEPNFVDEIDCGSFFDHIDDLLDFSADDSATADSSLPLTAAENIQSPATSFWQNAETGALPASHSAYPGDAAATDLSAELSIPYEDIVQLEWLSNFVEESFCGGMKKEETSNDRQFQISSPVSVVDESSNSCSTDKVVPNIPVRARTKRHRPATFSHHPVVQQFMASPASSFGENVTSKASSDSENFAESHPIINKLPRQGSGDHKKKKKTTKDKDDDNDNASVRKCMHCEISKTPQWRAGPMGPKTLCNACGVRYKSGRLFPEYRPAASPTFCPAVHSNSHKKVLEMRNKSASPELLIPNTLALDYI